MKVGFGLVDSETRRMGSSGRITPILLLQNGRLDNRLKVLVRVLKTVFRCTQMGDGTMIAVKVRAFRVNFHNPIKMLSPIKGQKLGYVCQAPQQYENCQYVNENDKKECGIGIISERLCDQLKCCFDPSALIQCYKPVRSVEPEVNSKNELTGNTVQSLGFIINDAWQSSGNHCRSIHMSRRGTYWLYEIFEQLIELNVRSDDSPQNPDCDPNDTLVNKKFSIDITAYLGQSYFIIQGTFCRYFG